MKYWLLSQNLLSTKYTENLKNSKKINEHNLYMWNWLYNEEKIKIVEDINLKNLDNPTRLEWRYAMIQFKDEMKEWDIIIVLKFNKLLTNLV